MGKIVYSYGYALRQYKEFKDKEKKYNLKLQQGKYYVIRFDGKGMTKAFKIKKQSINTKFFRTMKYTFNEFCKANNNILFAYSFSDEISILIYGNSKVDDMNRIEKLLSLMSCKLALLFYKYAKKNQLDLKNEDWLFDARIIELEKQEVINYFISRQAFAIDKYIMQLRSEHNIGQELNNSQKVIDKLRNLGINYDALPKEYRYGLIYSSSNQVETFEFYENKELLKDLCDLIDKNISAEGA